MKKILFTSILFFISYCAAPIVRLPNPKSEVEKKNHSIIAFSLYLVYPIDFDPKISEYNSKDLVYTPTFQTGGEIKLINIKDNSIYIEKPKIEVTEEGKVRVFNVLNQTRFVSFSIKDSFNEILIEDPNSKFAISELIFVSINGNSRSKYNYPTNPNQAFSVLPIQAKPGEIQYLGLFQARVVRSNSQEKYAKNIGMDLGNILFKGDTSDEYEIAEIRPDNGYLSRLENIQYDAKTLEINYLTSFIANQNEGYWKEKAEKRLKALTNKN